MGLIALLLKEEEPLMGGDQNGGTDLAKSIPVMYVLNRYFT